MKRSELNQLIENIVRRVITEDESWWNALGPEGQKEYIKNHPNSKKAKDAKSKETNSKESKPKFYQPKVNKDKQEIKFANDADLNAAKKYLEKTKGKTWKEGPNKSIKFLQTAEFKDMVKSFDME